MNSDPFSDIVTVDTNTIASIRHRLSVKLPDGWAPTDLPGPRSRGHGYVLAIAPQGQQRPLVAIQSYGPEDSLVGFVHTIDPARDLPSRARDRDINGIPATEVRTHGGPRKEEMCAVFVCVNGNGYTREAWTDQIERLRPLFEEILSSIEWNYHHEPRSLGEVAASNRAEREKARANRGPLETLIGLIVTAVILWFLFQVMTR